MKNKGIYILFLLMLFIGIPNVTADWKPASKEKAEKALGEEVGEYCEYNLTGAPNGQYNIIIAVSKDGKRAKSDTSLHSKYQAGTEPIMNWNKESSDYDKDVDFFLGYDYYVEHGCPPFVVHHKVSAYHNIYVIDNANYPNLIDSFGKVGSTLYILADPNYDYSTYMECDYKYSYDDGEDGEVSATIKFNKYGKILNIVELMDLKLYPNNEEDLQGEAFRISNEVKMNKNVMKVCPNLFLVKFLNMPSIHFVYFSDFASDNMGVSKEFHLKCTNTDSDYCDPESKDANYCPQYLTYSNMLDSALIEYKNCSTNNCKIAKKAEYNKNSTLINNWCSSVIQQLNYDNPCVISCLDLQDVLYDNEELIYGNTQEKVCGFSERLIIWIANIVRWVKYLIPVVAIVLGILDFIKAISEEKEDEMKKAQGKFIKRLIAAALIFIIPFIIEFILNKMGFASNGCGIIDL